MATNALTVRPGLLVGFRTIVRTFGNVSYDRTPERRRTGDSGEVVSKWETTKRVVDPKEHKAGNEARSDIRGLVRSICINTPFGLLCPEADESKLDKMIRDSRKIADDFNAKAKLTRVDFYVLKGRVAQNDAEAIRAIQASVAEMTEQMESAISNIKLGQKERAKEIRDAANKAREISAMLSDRATETVNVAIAAARAAARKIVKATETEAKQIDRDALKQIAAARTAFLQIEKGGDGKVKGPKPSARAVELPTAAAAAAKAKRTKPAARKIDL